MVGICENLPMLITSKRTYLHKRKGVGKGGEKDGDGVVRRDGSVPSSIRESIPSARGLRST